MSRPGSGSSARSVASLILASRPSATTPESGKSEQLMGAGGPLAPLPGDAMSANLIQMLPENIREDLLRIPADVREQLLSAAAAALQSSGVGEAIQIVSTLPSASVLAGAAGPSRAQWHGLLGGSASWNPPKTAAHSTQAARPGYDAYDATEYLDTPDVLQAKVKMLAQMWKRSGKDTVVYTGAGLSTASGIGDYASKASTSVAPHKTKSATGSRFDLRPTLAHHALAALGEKGFVGNWVQQNHDRLAQKAGFPQAKLNEIHGAWGDMKNQVLMMDDALRPDLLDWLIAWAERANLCVALGTSLCGMNADRVPRAVAKRFGQSSGEGLVIIGLQRTVYDDVASLRIWGLCDDVMKSVAKELGCKAQDPKVAKRGADWEHRHPRLSYNTPVRKAKDPM